MKIVLIPTYKDVFEGKSEQYFKLVEDIPSRVIITLMSFINNQLIDYRNDRKKQIELFDFVVRRLEPKEKARIANQINKFYHRANSDIALFGLRYTMEFINRELVNYRDFDFIDTTPEQELRIFKAYLKIVEDLTTNDAEIISNSHSGDNSS